MCVASGPQVTSEGTGPVSEAGAAVMGGAALAPSPATELAEGGSWRSTGGASPVCVGPVSAPGPGSAVEPAIAVASSAATPRERDTARATAADAAITVASSAAGRDPRAFRLRVAVTKDASAVVSSVAELARGGSRGTPAGAGAPGIGSTAPPAACRRACSRKAVMGDTMRHVPTSRASRKRHSTVEQRASRKRAAREGGASGQRERAARADGASGRR